MSSRVVAIIVANATCVVAPGAIFTRTRRLAIGSRTAPVKLVSGRPSVMAIGACTVRPRPRKRARSVSNSMPAAASLAITCAPKSSRSVTARGRREKTSTRNLRHELAADEEVRERRVREVRGRRRERDLRVRRDLDLGRSRAEVAQRQPPYLGVVLGRDDHFEHRLDVAVLAHDPDAVLVERDVVARRLDADRLVPGRPHPSVARVAQVDEAAVVVAASDPRATV